MSALRKPEPLPFGAPTSCPCCGGAVSTPKLDVVILRYGISDFQARILTAVWNGRGHPVPTQRIFDLMYEDDFNGGPSVQKMYEALKLGLRRLRERLEGSGVAIESAGYRRGWALRINQRSNQGELT